MAERCPFCWGPNVKPVGAHPRARLSGGGGWLMECEECEKWYWAGREEEAAPLFMHCQTAIIHPHCCYEEIREIIQSAGTGFPKRRVAEFNHLCAQCSNGLFLPEPDSPAQRRSSKMRAL